MASSGRSVCAPSTLGFLAALILVVSNNIEASEHLRIHKTNFFSNINVYLQENAHNAQDLGENQAKVKEYLDKQLEQLDAKFKKEVEILIPDPKVKPKPARLGKLKACFGGNTKEPEEESKELEFWQKDDLISELADLQQQVEACDCLDKLRLISKSNVCSQTNRRLIEQAVAAVEAEQAEWHSEYNRVEMIISKYKAMLEDCQ